MKEREDHIIADKIRQVFDNFEDPSSEQGWQELRKKFPDRNRKPLFIWIGSAAALLLLFSGLWFLNSNISQVDQVVNNKTGASEDIKSKDTLLTTDNTNVAKTKESSSSYEIARAKNINSGNNHFNPPETIKSSEPAPTSERNVLAASSQKIIQTNNQELSTHAMEEYSLAGRSNAYKNQIEIRDSLIGLLAKMSSLNPLSSLDNKTLLPLENIRASSQNNNKSFSFSLYAGSYFNYAEGSESNLNFGAGFSSDIRLSKNLRLSTGLNLAKNSLRYNDDLPSNADQSFKSSSATGSGNLTTTNLTSINNFNADLLSLDIPLNIKYLLSSEKKGFYLQAGLSSGTYLKETYGLQYRNYSTVSGNYTNQGQAQTIKKYLQDFDLARTFNLAIGFSTNLNKTQNITIEPFLKYPLGGLGTENLKFGSLGMNLKLNFKSTKK